MGELTSGGLGVRTILLAQRILGTGAATCFAHASTVPDDQVTEHAPVRPRKERHEVAFDLLGIRFFGESEAL